MRFFFLLLLLSPACDGCRKQPQPAATQDQGAAAPGPTYATAVVTLSSHDTQEQARAGLQAALSLSASYPLPYPRVEHSGSRYRVIAGRGKMAAMAALSAELTRLGHSPQLGDGAVAEDVVRMAIRRVTCAKVAELTQNARIALAAEYQPGVSGNKVALAYRITTRNHSISAIFVVLYRALHQ